MRSRSSIGVAFGPASQNNGAARGPVATAEVHSQGLPMLRTFLLSSLRDGAAPTTRDLITVRPVRTVS